VIAAFSSFAALCLFVLLADLIRRRLARTDAESDRFREAVSYTSTTPRQELTIDSNQLTYFRGRVALAAILRGLGVKRGDEVLIQAFTCIAGSRGGDKALAQYRATWDVARGSPNMDPDDLASKITDLTRAGRGPTFIRTPRRHNRPL
jgi:hypothetical protein